MSDAPTDPEIRERIAANEGAFREVNEGIARGQWPGEDDALRRFRCECARLGCNRMLELSVREYERIRANPRLFVVTPGHELPDAETVVEVSEGYVVVEKVGSAARVAEDTDPRA
jgi:hypothetical protein